MSDTMKDFLLARIAEDETNAELYLTPFPDEVVAPLFRRLLAECAVKRAIIGSYDSCAAVTEKEEHPGVKLTSSGMTVGLELAIKSLASVYSGHRDYRQEWALDG